MFRGHNNIVYGYYTIFRTRIDFKEMFAMSLDFADIKNTKLEDLKVLRRSPDLLKNVKIGRG